MDTQSKIRSRTVFVAAFIALMPTLCFGQAASQITAADIYQRTHSSVVVVIVADRNSKPFAQGSGFIVAKNRIVTNHHVVEGAAEAVVVFADGNSERVEGVAADSPARDLAILAANTGSRLPLKLRDEISIRQGDPVYALGAPRGLELSLTNGIVSGFRDFDDQLFLQTTAAIAPGSSGGPLFDSSGRVIGVTTALLGDSPGIYFSIDARDVQRLLQTPNLVSRPFSVWSHENRDGAESAPTSEAGGNKANSSPSITKVWKNLRDGQTYRTRSNADMLYLESVDDYLTRAGDLISCKFHRAVSVGISWSGVCWERNPKDQSVYQSEATLTMFSETRIEGSTKYIPKFALIPAADAPSTTGLLVTTEPPGAEVFINGIKQVGTMPTALALAPGQYALVLKLEGYEPYAGSVQVGSGVQTQLPVKLTKRKR